MSIKADFFVEPHLLANADAGEPVLVALSGGADSACLLHLMHDYSERVGCRLCAAHVNHNIRTQGYADEAARDERFCRELCARLGIDLFVLSADVPAIAKDSGESIELCARRIRYAFFADIMQKEKISILATAHNADDNLETQIFNLCRGCSVDGLIGIPRQRRFDEADGVIVRPILDATKAEILELCEREKIEFVTDSTNGEDDCTRNRIRHRIIPELESLFGTPQRAAMRLSQSAECDASFIRAEAQDFIREQGDSISAVALCKISPAVATRALAICFKEAYGSSLEAAHIQSIMKIAASGREGAAVSLPCRARAIIRRGRIIFENDVRDKDTRVDYEISLESGLTLIPDTPFAVCLHDGDTDTAPAPLGYELYASATLYCDSPLSLTARNRREGDTVQDGGMHKKLKKLMCDKKTDAGDRDSLPLICQNGEIIYAPLCAVEDSARRACAKQKINVFIYKASEVQKL